MAFISFAITAALGGFAGAVITPAQFTSADVIGLPYGIFGFVAAVLGGFGTMSGTLVGGILLGVASTRWSAATSRRTTRPSSPRCCFALSWR